jgi:hypothetical protein
MAEIALGVELGAFDIILATPRPRADTVCTVFNR